MKKDILIPIPKGIKLGVVKNEDHTYDVFLINENDHGIRNILMVATASELNNQSSTIRFFLESMVEFSYSKIETILEDVMKMANNITVTYYIGIDIYEKVFQFSLASLTDEVEIAILSRSGYLLE